MAITSKYLPSSTSVITTPDASKYTCRVPAGNSCGASVTSRLYPNAAVVPIMTSVFMSGLRWRSAAQPCR